MPSLHFHTIHRPDRSPSQRFRHEQYLDYFRSQGFDLHFSYLLSEAQDRIYYSSGQWLKKAGIVGHAALNRLRETLAAPPDLVYVQRESFMLGSSWFERQMARRSALVFDFDDAIWLADVSEGNKGFSWLKSSSKTSEIIRQAHEVIAGNQYLADYALQFNQRVSVIPTTIDTDYHLPRPKQPHKDSVCIGWTGSLTTVQYFHDFAPLLIRLKKHLGSRVRFKLIGEVGYRNEELELQGEPWRLSTEIEDLNDMDIGIMPLPDNEWTQGKCGFKGLQYMGCGIPAVMSPVGVNKEIIQDGVNGFLAHSEEEWFEKLSQLVESAELRQRLGRAGRKTVEERYSVRSQRERYVQVLNKALAQRSRLP